MVPVSQLLDLEIQACEGALVPESDPLGCRQHQDVLTTWGALFVGAHVQRGACAVVTG